MNLQQSFYVKPLSHEIVNTTVRLSDDARPALIGTVIDDNENPIETALVTLYQADMPTTPVGVLYTDEQGRFSFGPLCPDMLYQVRIFKAGKHIRALEQNTQ